MILLKPFFLKKNNNHFSIEHIERALLKLKTIKKNNSLVISDHNIKQIIRRKNVISLKSLDYINEINIFSYEGIIKKKNKQNNLNNSVTIKALISNKFIEINFHLYSDGIRLE